MKGFKRHFKREMVKSLPKWSLRVNYMYKDQMSNRITSLTWISFFLEMVTYYNINLFKLYKLWTFFKETKFDAESYPGCI